MKKLAVALLLALAPCTTAGQELRETVRLAQTAFNDFDFPAALTFANQALTEDLTEDERAIAYEVIGFSYGALDSVPQAVDALRNMIVIQPDREPDPERLPPRLVSLYTQALAQVLVVRHLRVDSASFVAGRGTVPIRFEISRPAWAVTRIIGAGFQSMVDSQLVEPGPVRVDWSALDTNGEPVAPTSYQVIVTAREGRNQYQSPTGVVVSRTPVDTVDHLVALAGFTEQPETEVPPRDWRPLGLAAVYTGLTSGAAIALENSALGGVRREILGVSAVTMLAGLYLSLRRAEPRPLPSGILYNQLLRQMLADRNQQIAAQNAQRRRQVRLTIVQTP